ncbi:hypothetical protein GN958_ATG01543, partial [Phytophthora infestans]
TDHGQQIKRQREISHPDRHSAGACSVKRRSAAPPTGGSNRRRALAARRLGRQGMNHSYLNSDEASIHVITHVGPFELGLLWGVLVNHATVNWSTGRHKSVLMSSGSRHYHSRDDGKFELVIVPFLFETMVTSVLDKLIMKRLVLRDQAPANYPNARYASDEAS